MSPYVKEMQQCSSLLPKNVPGFWTLNTSYEWACTVGMSPSENGTPSHLRVLDWMTPGLGTELCATVQGPIIMLTWPGYAGCVTGMRRGAFSLALNQPPLGDEQGFIGQFTGWLGNRKGRYLSQAMPPSHLLRMVLENCENASDAIDMIRNTPVCAGAIYSMAGTSNGETWLIEKEKDRFIVHSDTVMSCANHWPSDKKCVSIRGDSINRNRYMMSVLDTPDLFELAGKLSSAVILDETRVVCVMNPASGRMSVQGYEKTGPVTQITEV